MTQQLKNIVEDIARDYLNSALTLRYDICTCPTCKNDMLAYILSHIPAKYVTSEQGALHTIISQTRMEHQALIAKVILHAIELVSTHPHHAVKEDKQKTFELLIEKIKEERNLDFSHYHQDLLRRRVAIRIRSLKLDTYADYLRYLMNTPEEYDRLFEVLCINVSEFLRDPEVWGALSRLLTGVAREKKVNGRRQLRIWSAGCACGEEPYTISILLSELLGQDLSGFDVTIKATDVDKLAMKIAREGAYERSSVKNLDKKLIEKYFHHNDGKYQAREEIKKRVEISYLDLTTQDMVPDTDLIFCRNVFIYFDRNLQEQILMKFYSSLKLGGYLIMGKSESMIREVKTIFREIDAEARIFQKIEPPANG